MKKLRLLLAALAAVGLTQGAWAAFQSRKITQNNLVYRLVYDVPNMPWTQCLELVGVENNPTTVYIPLSVTEGGVTYSYSYYSGVPNPLFYNISSSTLPYYLFENEWFEDDVNDLTLYNQRLAEHIQSLTQSSSSVTTLSIPLDPELIIAGFENVEFLNVYGQGSNGTELRRRLMSDRTKLQRVEYPENVTVIGDYCFDGCTLLSTFSLNNCIEEIGDMAFRNCSSLSSSTFFDNCTALAEIGAEAFKGCTALPKITFNREVSLGESAFAGCTGLTRATFAGNATLGASALANCTSLSTATFSGEALLGSNTFQGCSSLTSITIGSLNPQSDAGVFNYGALRSLTIQSMNSTVLGMTLCRNCSQLQTINFPASFFQQSQLPEGYFEGCTNLTQQLEFSNLNYIGSKVFSGISGINLKLTGSGGISMATDAFQNTTGTLYVRYGLRDYYASHQATKHLTIVEYDAPAPTAYQVVAAESLPSWYSQYTTAQLSAVKHLKVTGELTTESLTTICNLCKNNGGSVQLQTLDLTEVTNETLQSFPAGAFTLDTLYLPRATQTLGGDFFNTFSSDIVVVAPWTTNLPARTWTEASVNSRTLIVPPGSLYTYKAADGWKGFGTIKTTGLEGEVSLLLISGRANKPVELWIDGEQVGTIEKKGGTILETVDGSASVELRVPTQYLDKILLNGTNMKAVLTSETPTDAAYSGYNFYYVEDFTATTVIEIVYEGVPEVFETYGLVFNVNGGPGTANVSVSYGDGTSESFDITNEGNSEKSKILNYYQTDNTGQVFAKLKEVERIVVTAHPETDEFALTYFGTGYRNQQQVENNVAMFEAVNNGDGTYTYTLPGKNMTTSYVYLTFPAQQTNSTKTIISVADGINVGYFFYNFDIGLGYYNVNMTDPGTYVSGTANVMHGDDSDSNGKVFIYVPENSTNFRVILNGEVVPIGRGSKAWLEWNGDESTSYDNYMENQYMDGNYNYNKVACYQLSIFGDIIAQDSWIVIDDGTTPLDQIVSPFQITQTVTTMDVFERVYLIDKNGNETDLSGSGNVTTWTKGEPMTVEVSRILGNSAYEATLIVDGTEIPLQYDADKNRFTGYELSEVNTSHTIVLQMKKVKYSFTAYVGAGNTVAIAEIDEEGNVIENGGGGPENIGMTIANTSGLRLTLIPAEGNVLTGLAMDGAPISLDDERLTQDASGNYVFTLPAGTIYASDHQIYASFSVPEGDLNHDGKITIADVTKLVNIILGK